MSHQASPPDHPAIAFSGVKLLLGGSTIYADLSFTVGAGEFVCLLGPSGCGKSSALRLIGGLLPYQAGDVQVEGLAPKQAWQKLAYVFQAPRLLPWKDARDNAAFGLEMRKPELGMPDRRKRAMDELARVGLAEVWTWLRPPSQLSEGQRWRLRLALAMHAVDSDSDRRPTLIVCDEFAALLDRVTAFVVAGVLRRFVDTHAARVSAIVATSHDDLRKPLDPDAIAECDFGQVSVRQRHRRPTAR